MKTLLCYISGASDPSDEYINLLPVGLCSIQSYLKENNFDSILANFSTLNSKQVVSQISEISPDVIGFSIWTHNRVVSLEIARKVRKLLPDVFIVAGGGDASFRYDEILSPKDSPFNAVIIGEGELTFASMLGALERQNGLDGVDGIAFKTDKNIIVNRKRELIDKLDTLPFQSKYFESSIGVNKNLQSEFIITSRGCPSACYFCSSPNFWGGKVRFRSARSVVDEIKFVKERYGNIYFSIRDDTFTANKKRVIDICNLLIEENIFILWNCQSRVTHLDEELVSIMKRAGCECIQLGIESGSQAVLEKLGKKITIEQVIKVSDIIHKIGINLSVYLISDVDGETEDDLTKTETLIKRIKPNDGYVSPLAYFPGTKLFTDAVAEKKIERNIFAIKSETAIYLNNKPKAQKRVLSCLTKYRFKSCHADFIQQKSLIGYCYVTNTLFGFWLQDNGRYNEAEREFKEICKVEPKNIWGWYLLGELYRETAKNRDAKRCYERCIELLPTHQPSLDKLLSIKKEG